MQQQQQQQQQYMLLCSSRTRPVMIGHMRKSSSRSEDLGLPTMAAAAAAVGGAS
jgi:hypothetical protein